MARQGGVDFGSQGCAILYAAPDAVKALVLVQIRAANQGHELFPHCGIPDRDIERAVGGLERAVRRDQGMMIPGWYWIFAGLEVNSRRPAQDADDRFQQRSLDTLAAASAMAHLQRQQNPLHREDPAQQIADRDTGPRWTALDRAGHAHQAGHALGYLIEARIVAQRPGRAEARNTATDDARIARRQLVVTEADFLDDAGAEIVDQDVGRVGQAAQNPQSLLLLDIEHDAFFRAIAAQEEVIVRATARSQLGAGIAGRLDFDHLGSVIAQDLRGKGSR